MHTLWNQFLLELSLDLFNTVQICYKHMEDVHKEVWCWNFFFQTYRVFNLVWGYQVSLTYCQVSLDAGKQRVILEVLASNHCLSLLLILVKTPRLLEKIKFLCMSRWFLTDILHFLPHLLCLLSLKWMKWCLKKIISSISVRTENTFSACQAFKIKKVTHYVGLDLFYI